MTRAGQRNPKRSPTPTSATAEQPPIGSAPPSPNPSSLSLSASQNGGSRRSPSPSRQPKPLYLSSPFVDAALVKGNFKTIVMLPKYVDIMEWVAVNGACSLFCSGLWTGLTDAEFSLVFDFYTNLNEFYGVITDVCTQQTCPTMSAGHTYVSTLISLPCICSQLVFFAY